jgi:hypothetical protein
MKSRLEGGSHASWLGKYALKRIQWWPIRRWGSGGGGFRGGGGRR